eukprot:TRINITY_DN6381_c0_g1_i3.p1 TRINITY_DN6381_c0_g1~~TRINITY_DN6381_c0_g1_i3.p1  ORF type:complete len:240 (+),score=72.68 TRINITY_DN6381_c0_g1_i3:41-760(+)
MASEKFTGFNDHWRDDIAGANEVFQDAEKAGEDYSAVAKGNDRKLFDEVEAKFNSSLSECEELCHALGGYLEDRKRDDFRKEEGLELTGDDLASNQGDVDALKKRLIKLQKLKEADQVQSMKSFGHATAGASSQAAKDLVSEVQTQRAELELEEDREEQLQIMIAIEAKVDRLKDSAEETNRELREQNEMIQDTGKKMEHFERDGQKAVSYTHLTLPTKRIVEISVGGALLKKKKKTYE